jgi:hypothetical protein
MKNLTTKPLLLAFFCMMLFTAITHAQCPAGLLANEELKEGKKVTIAEVYKDESNPELYQDLVGKTLAVGKLGLVNIGDCWFMGDLNVNGEDVFFVGVTLKAAQGETYDGPVIAAETIAASDFPVGSRVLVHNIPATDKNSMSFYSDAPTQDRGDVIEADLVKNANGTYSGCILTGKAGESYRTRKCFTECKAEKTVY